MVPEVGLFCLILALMMAMIQTVAAPLGFLSQRFSFLQDMLKPACFGQCFFVTLSFITLVHCFLQDDFSVSYVAQNSHTHLPLPYKICASWGAHEGSLLLWAFILAIWTLIVALYGKKLPTKVTGSVLGILGAVSVGFLLLLLETSNPFLRTLPFVPQDGADLNPLLQDPGFVMHPPFLYMGYVGFAIPFAFAMVGMIKKEENIPWDLYARPFALLSFSFLTLGITLGSWWAYYELGWGGWWFWDPVENASFMPWLVGAALVHSLLLSRDEVHAWRILLAICAFILSLIGTFLVRSGIVSSVHAFASDPLRGNFILTFIAIVVASSFTLFIFRARALTSHYPLLSRGSLVLFGNMILFVAMLTILLGTLYPIFMEVLLKERLSIGPPYFNAVFVPIMLPLLFVMSVAPLVRNYTSPSTCRSHDLVAELSAPSRLGILDTAHKAPYVGKKVRDNKKWFLVFLGIVLIILYFMARYTLWVGAGVGLGVWVVLGTLFKTHQVYKRKGSIPLVSVGMILAHLGIGIGVIGMSLTSALSEEKEVMLKIGESTSVQGYEFIFEDLRDIQGSNYEGVQGVFTLSKKDYKMGTLTPEKRYFIPRQVPMTETAIRAGLVRDFYIALGESLGNGVWSVRIYVKPFVRWIWLGGILVALGALISGLMAFHQVEGNER